MSSEKRKRWYFASGSARKPPFFSVFKSVNRSKKATTPKPKRRRRARKSQGVVLCSHVDKDCVSWCLWKNGNCGKSINKSKMVDLILQVKKLRKILMVK